MEYYNEIYIDDYFSGLSIPKYKNLFPFFMGTINFPHFYLGNLVPSFCVSIKFLVNIRV